jgi:hypothetical protein
MAEILLIKELSGKFIPAYDTDLELAKKIKVGDIYRFKYSRPRNIKFHKKFFALIKLVFENQENYTDIDDLRYDLTIEAGFWEEKTNFITGEVKRIAKSINFGSMDEDEFSKLYTSMLDTVIRVFGWSGEDIEENIAEFM